MHVVWDEIKPASNLTKHGLDFAAFETGFDPRTAIQITARDGATGQQRLKIIGLFEGRFLVSAIIAPLGTQAIALISLRRASRAERKLLSDTGRRPSDAEETEIQTGILADPDNPEWTETEFRGAVPLKDGSPGLYADWIHDRDAVRTGTALGVSLTLDRSVVERFMAAGPGWERRMADAVRQAADALPD